ncbi:MAG: hypothetical protein ACQER9_02520 [Nanobdellota archaeon]
MLDSKTRELLRAIKENDFTHEGARKHYNKTQSIVIDSYNRKIDEVKKEHYPNIFLTQKLIDQFYFAANKVSSDFRNPTELIGTCSGINKDNKLFLKDFHVYHNQRCNRVKTETSGIGKIKTFSELKRKGLESLCVAHSHNVFKVFHSPTDEEMIINNTLGSTPKHKFRVRDIDVPMKYSIDLVFNQRTGKEENNPFIKYAVSVPKASKDEWIYDNVETFEQDFRILPYKFITDIDKERLSEEISERVKLIY